MHRAVDDALLDVVWPAQLAPATASQESQLDEVLQDASPPPSSTSSRWEIEGDRGR